ncbi:Aste57867_7489 [Aphanomyces stellatus]|uniref:Aste57867_7489 protein n=1 Tax=Aphanomyces stellatus TaxID=120398 RepID=A0A485KID5_9STRA|nr:hypothetical protein As57867_007463 [Aphanomyces stellatus]VFT84399.1 Aste57867_7489 [Aphanomyces stellatus]
MTGTFRNTDVLHNDVWLLTINDIRSTTSTKEHHALEWKQFESTNRPRVADVTCTHHTMVADGNYVYVFGNRVKGKHEFESFAFENHRFLVDITQGTAHWEAIPCSSNISARVGHATTRVSNKRVVSFGGRSVVNDEHFNDVIVFDLDVRISWWNFICLTVSKTKLTQVFQVHSPTANRSFYAMAALNSSVYVNGGDTDVGISKPELRVMGNTLLQTFDIDALIKSDGFSLWRVVDLLNKAYLKKINNKLRKDHTIRLPFSSSGGGTNVFKTPIMDPWAANIHEAVARITHEENILATASFMNIGCPGVHNRRLEYICPPPPKKRMTKRCVPIFMFGDTPACRSYPVLVKLNDSTLVCIGGKLPLQNDAKHTTTRPFTLEPFNAVVHLRPPMSPSRIVH